MWNSFEQLHFGHCSIGGDDGMRGRARARGEVVSVLCGAIWGLRGPVWAGVTGGDGLAENSDEKLDKLVDLSGRGCILRLLL